VPHISTALSLAVIGSVLVIVTIASLLSGKRTSTASLRPAGDRPAGDRTHDPGDSPPPNSRQPALAEERHAE
jgi:hypothetical protein